MPYSGIFYFFFLQRNDPFLGSKQEPKKKKKSVVEKKKECLRVVTETFQHGSSKEMCLILCDFCQVVGEKSKHLSNFGAGSGEAKGREG